MIIKNVDVLAVFSYSSNNDTKNYVVWPYLYTCCYVDVHGSLYKPCNAKFL
jgi:hypothetical protein